MTFFSMRNFLIVLLIIFSNQLFAQTCPSPIQSTANTGTGTNVNSTTVIGQSFIACEDGLLSKITVRVATMSNATINTELRVAEGNNTDENRLHTQPIMITGTGDLEINLSKTVELTAGQTYAFSLGGAGDDFMVSFSSSTGDTYSGGTLFQNTTALSTADLFFNLLILPIVPTTSIDFGEITNSPTIPVISNGSPIANQIITALDLPAGTYTFSTNPPAGTALTGPVTVTVRNAGGTIVGMFNITFNIPIPTMSQWGGLIFGLLILNLAIFTIRRKEALYSI